MWLPYPPLELSTTRLHKLSKKHCGQGVFAIHLYGIYFHEKIKHIDIRLYWMKDVVFDGTMQILWTTQHILSPKWLLLPKEDLNLVKIEDD
ncbi:hypothetical protein CR513_34485, partial [Mucuna pruriens]